jgi:ParB family chromosome partitioning protein
LSPERDATAPPKFAEAQTVPVRIVHLTDAEALEAQLIENLQRENVHPLEEAQGFRALLNLEEPRYTIEQIAARTGKSPAYCVGRLKLTELSPAVVEAFSKDEIGVGHALLLARLQPAQQEEALNACFREEWMGADQKPKRILLPVRQLQVWIERNVLLILKDAPFDRENPQLVPAAGSCLDCPKRTGHNKLLFAGISENSDACSDPDCYSAKLDAHVKTTIAAKPKLIQITTAYGKPAEGSPVLQRNRYVEIRQDKSEQKRDWPEYRTCKVHHRCPSLPMEQRRANSARFALTPIARYIIRRRRLRPTMQSGRPSRKSSGSRKLSLVQPVYAYYRPLGMPCQCVS